MHYIIYTNGINTIPERFQTPDNSQIIAILESEVRRREFRDPFSFISRFKLMDLEE